MEKQPLVSVGMPIYNRPESFKKALSSIINQTYENIEIIISDNCSENKEIIKIIDKFKMNDKRITFYQQTENIGALANFAFVEEKASGEYFMWASDDDYFHSKKLIEKLVEHIGTNVLCFSDFILSNEISSTSNFDSYSNCATGEDYLFAWLNNGSGHPIYGLYNRTLLKEIGLKIEFDDSLVYFNEGIILHKLFLTGRVKFVPEVFLFYDQNSKKPENHKLFSSFMKYFKNTLSLYEKEDLSDFNKEKSIKIIKEKYSQYLRSLFFSSSLKQAVYLYRHLTNEEKSLLWWENGTFFSIKNVRSFLLGNMTSLKASKFLKNIGVGYLYRKILLVNNYILYKKEYQIFKSTNGKRFLVEDKDKYPCLNDKNDTTSFDKHYTYHTAWAARKVKDINPTDHVDISSLTYFSTLVSAFIPIKFYDYRPALIELDNFSCHHADITDLPFASNSVKSLSSMHVVEHIGLGRYGDPLDVDGDLKAIKELKRVLANDGYLLFVVPIGGTAKIMFNAHRIYSYQQVIDYFNDFELLEFTLIPDQSSEGLIVDATEKQSDNQNYGCGCFMFKKTRNT